ncbi:MAG: hypothetical protein V9819_02210 [Candidatus Dasytiphilus stammeri]
MRSGKQLCLQIISFLPFGSSIEEAVTMGITCVIQSVGSLRDKEVIASANEHNIAMILTSPRHFCH